MTNKKGLPADFDELEFISSIAEAPQIALKSSSESVATPRRESRGRRSRKEEYLSRFIVPRREFSSRQGKSIAILPEHHTKILQIVGVVDNNRFSIFNYIDNVLTDHLSRYDPEITEVFNEKSLIKLKQE
ncbi:MAG: DUF3408 domain-containing protein [Rikenellaceae bacterium]